MKAERSRDTRILGGKKQILFRTDGKGDPVKKSRGRSCSMDNPVV
jgi:hypothetical protein